MRSVSLNTYICSHVDDFLVLALHLPWGLISWALDINSVWIYSTCRNFSGETEKEMENYQCAVLISTAHLFHCSVSTQPLADVICPNESYKFSSVPTIAPFFPNALVFWNLRLSDVCVCVYHVLLFVAICYRPMRKRVLSYAFAALFAVVRHATGIIQQTVEPRGIVPCNHQTALMPNSKFQTCLRKGVHFGYTCNPTTNNLNNNNILLEIYC